MSCDMSCDRYVNPFTTTDRFSSIQNKEWKSPIKLLSVERVNDILGKYQLKFTTFDKKMSIQFVKDLYT